MVNKVQREEHRHAPALGPAHDVGDPVMAVEPAPAPVIGNNR